MQKTVGALLFIALFSTLFLNVFIANVNAQATEVKVVPSTQEIGEEGVVLPTPPCTVNIMVTDVVELYVWEIRVYFDPTILKYKGAWLPTDHVFAGEMYMPVTPVVDVDENGTYISYGCTLLGEDSFSGSGTLCQINFTGIAPGSSPLTFGPVPRTTFLLDYDSVIDPHAPGISFEVTDGNIRVKGIPFVGEISAMTIDVTPDSTRVGSSVTISGTITPPHVGVNVTIYYKVAGEPEWIILANVPTDSESRYTYIWTTTETGTYEVYSSWPGDLDTWGADTLEDTKTVEIIVEIAMTIDVTPDSTRVNSSVTISGTITPPHVGVNVTIYYKVAGEPEWIILANVPTDSESRYTYIWTTTETGTYEIKASWIGYAYTDTKTVRVTEKGAIDIIPYAIAGIVAVAIILAILIYFIKFRKR